MWECELPVHKRNSMLAVCPQYCVTCFTDGGMSGCTHATHRRSSSLVQESHATQLRNWLPQPARCPHSPTFGFHHRPAPACDAPCPCWKTKSQGHSLDFPKLPYKITPMSSTSTKAMLMGMYQVTKLQQEREQGHESERERK